MYIEFYCAHFVILAFRFQSHLRTQSDIPNTDSIRHYAQFTAFATSRWFGTAGTLHVAGWCSHVHCCSGTRVVTSRSGESRAHGAFQQKDTKGMEIAHIPTSPTIQLRIVVAFVFSTFPTSSPFDFLCESVCGPVPPVWASDFLIFFSIFGPVRVCVLTVRRMRAVRLKLNSPSIMVIARISFWAIVRACFGCWMHKRQNRAREIPLRK